MLGVFRPTGTESAAQLWLQPIASRLASCGGSSEFHAAPYAGGPMNKRFTNILNQLSTEPGHLQMSMRWSPYVIEGFSDMGENMFALETKPSMLAGVADTEYANVRLRNDNMIVQFFPPLEDDNVLTIRIVYIFGGLQPGGTNLNSFSRQVFTLLAKNSGTFAGTGAYLAIEPQDDGTVHATLNSMLHFLVDWSDEDIANILCFQLTGMYKSLENYFEPLVRDESLTILKRYE